MTHASEPWRDRLETRGEDPRMFLLLGQTLGQLMDLADKGFAPAGAQIVIEQAAAVDWDTAYADSPHVLAQVARCFDPTLTADPPSHDRALGPLLRETVETLKGVMGRVDCLTDQRTGLFTDEAMRTNELQEVMDCVLSQLGSFLVELKVATDHVLAVMTWKTTMRELLASAEAGDDAALCKVLSVNPWLAYHAGIARRIQQTTATRAHRVLRAIQQAITHRPPPYKNAKTGFIMAVLWDAGLEPLTYPEIRGFLQAVGLHDVPSPKALERYGQRLGLTKYYVAPSKDRG